MNKGFIMKNNGITLIALVITIIVLLILAGISISMLIGNNGILNQAINATIMSDISGVIEQSRLDIIAKQMENDNYDGITEEEFIEILEKYGSLEYTDTVLDGTLTTEKGNKIKVSDIYNKIIITPHYITAEDVQNDPKTYYGKVVETGGNQGNLEEDYEWEIFYSDGTNIYLIAEDYINYQDAPEKNGVAISHSTSSSYKQNCYWSSKLYGCYEGYLGISAYQHVDDYCWNSKFCEAYGDDTCSTISTKCVSYMLDERIWEDKFSGQFQDGVVEYIIGGPTLEQFLEAYNDFYRDTEEEYEYTVENESYGYILKLSTDSSYDYLVVTKCTLDDDNNFLFISDDTNAHGMWLSSPCAFSDRRLNVAYGSGMVGYNTYDDKYLGFRPLVCLKSNIKLLENGELEYEIVN